MGNGVTASQADMIDGFGTSKWSYATRFGITGVALIAVIYLCWFMASSYVHSMDKQIENGNKREGNDKEVLLEHIKSVNGLALEVKEVVTGIKETQNVMKDVGREMKSSVRDNSKAALSIQQSVEKLIQYQESALPKKSK